MARPSDTPPSPLEQTPAGAGAGAVSDSATSIARPLILLLLLAAAVRVGVLVAMHTVIGGTEINDDYWIYEIMTRHPLMLVTGEGVERLGDAAIYAPLVPLHLWFPGALLSHWMGDELGRRVGMLCYDLAALGVALAVAFRTIGAPRRAAQWAAAILLTILPASVGASVVWGQEDTAAATWSAAALACFVWAGPVLAMVVAGAGLFTCKMFFVVLMLGIWLATPPARRPRVAAAGAACVAAFATFLLARWLASGFLYPEYHYHAMSNSPSVWALFYLLVKPLEWDYAIRGYVQLLVAAAMIAFVAIAWKRRLTVWSATVAAHCVFFAAFIGIHPEHYQWFLPLLIVFAWDSLVARQRYLAFWAAVGVTYLAYAYKIVYGLRGPVGNTAGGKKVVRDWFEQHVGVDLKWLQVALIFATLSTLLVLAWEALRAPVSTDARAR